MLVRAIRGAITAQNNKDSIIASAKELLREIKKKNQLEVNDIISILFTSTVDLNAAFPAAAARELGWKYVPLMCANEIDVPESLQRCIRVLVHVYTDKTPEDINHVYLKEAKKLRPDLSEE